jgi:hypothetical protein
MEKIIGLIIMIFLVITILPGVGMIDELKLEPFFYDNVIDDIRIFNKLLNSNEIVDVYRKITINNPPNKPTIEGVKSGKVSEIYDYTISSVDPDGDEVFFEIEWFVGCINILWEGPYESGEEVIMSNSWSEEGTHIITVRVKDMFDLEGESATFEVSMPKNKTINEFNSWLFRLIQRFPILEFLL